MVRVGHEFSCGRAEDTKEPILGIRVGLFAVPLYISVTGPLDDVDGGVGKILQMSGIDDVIDIELRFFRDRPPFREWW